MREGFYYFVQFEAPATCPGEVEKRVRIQENVIRYLVVRKDGEIVCYHFYNQNDVEDYLYKNTRFERASRTRYGFGKLYRGEDGSVYMKLNLQIRFKK